ncbi:MAG: hypothetical protein AAF092_10585 [Pseudomonadota bacterium]
MDEHDPKNAPGRLPWLARKIVAQVESYADHAPVFWGFLSRRCIRKLAALSEQIAVDVSLNHRDLTREISELRRALQWQAWMIKHLQEELEAVRMYEDEP